MTAPALDIRGLTVSYPGGARPAVADFDLAVGAGRIVGLVGESGSGKSTVALAVLGLTPPSARVSVSTLAAAGADLAALRPPERRARQAALLAYVPQEPLSAMNPTLRVGRQVDLVLARRWPKLGPGERRDLAAQALSRMEVADPERVLRAYPFQLSGGQLQRVLIAQALSVKPALVLADEATTALDVTAQAEVLALLRDGAAAEGAAVLFISHNIGAVRGLCDEVAVMRAGRIVEQGPAEKVLSNPASDYARELLAALPGRSPPRTPLPVGDAA